MSLTGAHKGYEYQDILVAIRLIDVLLENTESVKVDEKLVETDKFDDLTTIDAEQKHERVQIKHSESADQALSISDFVNESNRFWINDLINTALLYRSHFSSNYSSVFFGSWLMIWHLLVKLFSEQIRDLKDLYRTLIVNFLR